MIDDYRILGIVKRPHINKDGLLVLWDTSGSQTQWCLFETPSDKVDVVYRLQHLMSSASAWSGIGLHRADPNQGIVGVVYQASHRNVRPSGTSVVIISTADLCAYASTRSADEQEIRWEKWRSSAEVMKIDPAFKTTACISGSRFFAVIEGIFYTPHAKLLRVYDFSPGARGRRHPNRPPVRGHILNAERVAKHIGTISWNVSEDNLLMFNVSAKQPDSSALA